MKMQTPSSGDFDPALYGYLLVSAAIAALLVFAFIRLFEPTALPNPGLAAYRAPPATSLIPPVQKMDAPELAAIPPEPANQPAAETTAAVAQKVDEPKRVAHNRAHKPRPETRAHVRPQGVRPQERQYGYAQRQYGPQRQYGLAQRQYGYAQWDGGFRPWF